MDGALPCGHINFNVIMTAKTTWKSCLDCGKKYQVTNRGFNEITVDHDKAKGGIEYKITKVKEWVKQ